MKRRARAMGPGVTALVAAAFMFFLSEPIGWAVGAPSVAPASSVAPAGWATATPQPAPTSPTSSTPPSTISPACVSGNADACVQDSNTALDARNPDLVVTLLTKACDLDEPKACMKLAIMYLHAVLPGDQMDLAGKQLVKWQTMMEQACDRPDAVHADRCEIIANCLDGGRSETLVKPGTMGGVMVGIVSSDAAKSTALYAKVLRTRVALCQTSGEAGSCYALARQYQQGNGSPVDETKATAMFLLACKAKHPSGCTPTQVRGDACDRGDVDACDALCGAGDDQACDRASTPVRAAAMPRLAVARATRLLAECAADKAQIEKLRGMRVSASRNHDKKAADEAVARAQEIEPRWRATRIDIEKVLLTVGIASADWDRLAHEKEDKCTCAFDHDRPGKCAATVFSPIRHFQ